jgi:shikimate kinase
LAALAGWLRWSFLDLDDLITQAAGKSVTRDLRRRGKVAPSGRWSAALAEACDRKRLVIATGGGVGVTPGNLVMREADTVCLDVEPLRRSCGLALEAATRGDSADARPLLAGTDPLARLVSCAPRQRWYMKPISSLTPTLRSDTLAQPRGAPRGLALPTAVAVSR